MREHPEAESCHALGKVLHVKGRVLLQLDRREEAVTALKQSIVQARAARDKAPQLPRYRSHLTSAYQDLIRVLRQLGRDADADGAARDLERLAPRSP